MNVKLFSTLTAAATTLAVSAVAVPAHAFSFGNSGISFDSDTTVSFQFLNSHGLYQSALSVYNVTDNTFSKLFYETKPSDNPSAGGDWLGTFGNAVTSNSGLSTLLYTFAAGKTYTFLLDSGADGSVYSTDSLNGPAPGSMQAKFTGDLFNGGLTINFEDKLPPNFQDFNDFNVSAQAVPEPFTMAGIGLAGAGLAYVRRTRQRANV